MSDPSKRYRVLAVTRGIEIYVEIFDEVTKTGVVVPFPEILTVGADINLEVARIMEGMVDDMRQGTIPAWERLKSEWGPHGEGTADQN